MQTGTLQTPVALFVFNRPGTTRRVFDAISKAQPAKLLLIADGPRQGRDEAEVCRRVREIVTSVSWPCEVFENFSERNLGCRERMISGLDWVFSRWRTIVWKMIVFQTLPFPRSARSYLRGTEATTGSLIFLVTIL